MAVSRRSRTLIDSVDLELRHQLEVVRRGYDVVPFMAELKPVAGMLWKPIPDEMFAYLVRSDDYRPVLAGAAPTWFEVVADQGVLTLIIYRARADELFYVLAPDR